MIKKGDKGEQEVIQLISCPNCGKNLMKLPRNYPLYDIQCVACSFRAQVKSNECKPKKEIFGSGWDVINKVMKAGFMIPPLIVNFKWRENGKIHQIILFYPFIPKTHLKKRILSNTARRGGYKMFNYVGLNELPSFTLYENI
jgi:hypothetical protein